MQKEKKLWEFIPNIEWVLISEIKPYPQNAKDHPKSQVEAIAQSIKNNGWIQPLVIDKQNVITIGHGRIEAAKLLGAVKVPCFRAEHLTEMQIRILRLADNKLNESSWNMKMVKIELKDFPFEAIKLTGFNPDIVMEVKKEDDDTPEVAEKAVAKLGDVYQLGNHRLMCGDSTDIDDVEKLMDGKKADMVFTDPPYNVDYSGKGKRGSKGKIMNDKMSSEDFLSFLDKVFFTYKAAAKNSCPFYVCHSSSSQIEFQKSMEKSGLKIRNQIIWNKTLATMGWGDYRWKHESIFYATQDGGNAPFYGDRCQYTVWDETWNIEKIEKHLKKIAEKESKGAGSVWTVGIDSGYKHPTQKPVELILIALSNSSKEGELVLDLFGGSGSTLIACEKAKRVNLTMELDPRFVDVIIKRWEEYTKQKAVKL